MLAVLILGLVALTGLCLWALILADRQRRRALARLARARADHVAPAPEPVKPRRVERLRWLARLDRVLSAAGIDARAVSLLMPFSLAVMVSYGALLMSPLHPVLGAVLALVVPPGGFLAWVNIRRGQYFAGFTGGLPEALDVFARGLRAGRPVADSLSIVVENADGPVRREFRRCHDALRMGTPLAECLDRLAARIPTAEVRFFAVSTALQAETGGNLIETMENLAAQLRERRKLKRKARALSSEARASAVVLSTLPFAVGALLLVLNAGYLAPLWTDPRGQMMALGALLSIGAGIALMLRMGKLDV